jgi:histidinol-phosphate phosphatase family protein
MTPNPDRSWTLFLDRDGVINKKMPEHKHVTSIEQFEFIPGALPALRKLSGVFGRIIVVTNQRLVDGESPSKVDFDMMFEYMLNTVGFYGGVIHKVYCCTKEDGPDRKPNIGMALQAKSDFPEIDFKKSWMVGDSVTDAAFAANCGITNFALVDSRYDLLSFAWEMTR